MRIRSSILENTSEILKRNKAVMCTISCEEEIIDSEEYLIPYRRQEEYGNLGSFTFTPVAPGKGKEQIDQICGLIKEEKKNKRLKKLRDMCPDALFNVWHSAKVKLGIARKK